jgi:hypothetical protein
LKLELNVKKKTLADLSCLRIQKPKQQSESVSMQAFGISFARKKPQEPQQIGGAFNQLPNEFLNNEEEFEDEPNQETNNEGEK